MVKLRQHFPQPQNQWTNPDNEAAKMNKQAKFKTYSTTLCPAHLLLSGYGHNMETMFGEHTEWLRLLTVKSKVNVHNCSSVIACEIRFRCQYLYYIYSINK